MRWLRTAWFWTRLRILHRPAIRACPACGKIWTVTPRFLADAGWKCSACTIEEACA